MILGVVMSLAGCATTSTEVVQVLRPRALPLSIDSRFEFRKVKMFLNDPKTFKTTRDLMIQFERERAKFGAVTSEEQQQREGYYYTFFWRTSVPGEVTIRFEYRQANIGPYIMAKEVKYPEARGSHVTKFSVIGTNYEIEGPITEWRAILIRGNRIVALTQSFQWN
jgi:hypothetical protein